MNCTEDGTNTKPNLSYSTKSCTTTYLHKLEHQRLLWTMTQVRAMIVPAAFMDDDASACYDRILTSLNGLENRRWGMPFRMSQFTTKFIESQIYSIQTGSGVSNFTYKFERDKQIQGSGQGIAWAGPRWINSGDTCSRILKNIARE